MGKALRLLNLQKDISDYDELIDNYDSSDRRRSLFDLIYPCKSRDRTHISFLRQINSNPCLICLSTCLSPRQVAERALLAVFPPGLTPGSSTRVKKLPAQTQTLPGIDLINSRDGSFDPEKEPQLVQLRE